MFKSGSQSTYVTLIVFLVGLVTGLIMMSLFGDQSNLRHKAEGGLLRTSAGRELLQVLHHYNGSLSQIVAHMNHPVSHDDVKKHDDAIGNKAPIKFGDDKFHNDDDSVAQELYKKARVFCWVMTTKDNHKKKAVHVKATWGKRCNKLKFISDVDDPTLPAVNARTGSNRDHLTAKTMKAFDLAFKDELENYDWFMKADDDTYVIVENLRYMLSEHNHDEPVFFGHHFKVIVNQGYFSGGGGYVISREALRRFGNRKPNDCAKDYGAEDVEFGKCMEKLGVKTGDSRDAMGRSRFHCFNPATHIHGGYPDWYRQYDKYGAKSGSKSMSDYSITFHYVDIDGMYDLEYFIYHLRPFGINSGHQHLNVQKTKR